ncbi:EthD domain-containing protein [Xylariaceae sp. FL0662B]|nr:EthD domain-containing protein [Xylariaceae sp. FL0662B]
MGEEEFHHYMSEIHAPLVRDALARHGITQYTMTHFTSSTKPLIERVTDAQFFNNADYDMITQIRFPDIQCFVNFRNDPYYKEKVMADHHVFTDPEKQFMSVGWVEDHIVDGKVVE